MKINKRNIGIKLGLRAFHKGLPCMPDADGILKNEKANLSMLDKSLIVDGWMIGWRSGELDSNGGW
jgi:hypothetical protein